MSPSLIITAMSYPSRDDGVNDNDVIDEVECHCHVTGVPYLQVDVADSQMATSSNPCLLGRVVLFRLALSWLVQVLKSVANAAFSEKCSPFLWFQRHWKLLGPVLRSYDFHRMPVTSLANASADVIPRL